MDYAQARMYQFRTGRFSTVDPVYAGLFEPQRWNRYAYARNNPVVYVDPAGLGDEPYDFGFTSSTIVTASPTFDGVTFRGSYSMGSADEELYGIDDTGQGGG